MKRLRAAVMVGTVALLATGFAAPAFAVSPVVRNCTADGGNGLTRHFTVAQLQSALQTMPSDVRQYSGCAQAITGALLRAGVRSHLKLTGANAGGGGGFPVVIAVVIALLVFLGTGYSLLVRRRRR